MRARRSRDAKFEGEGKSGFAQQVDGFGEDFGEKRFVKADGEEAVHIAEFGPGGRCSWNSLQNLVAFCISAGSSGHFHY